MNYKLAKQLKEAGFRVLSPVFPQVADKQGYTDTGDEILRDYYDYHKESWNYEGEHYFIPTLSELIEACGNGFKHLHRGVGEKEWSARGEIETISYGKTPEEAVARLYIKLNS